MIEVIGVQFKGTGRIYFFNPLNIKFKAGDHVIVETVKKAEADDGMIVRMYDAFDCRTNAKITVADGFSKAYLCDLMENELSELDFDGKSVTVPVSNFEIVTLKFAKWYKHI